MKEYRQFSKEDWNEFAEMLSASPHEKRSKKEIVKQAKELDLVLPNEKRKKKEDCMKINGVALSNMAIFQNDEANESYTIFYSHPVTKQLFGKKIKVDSAGHFLSGPEYRL